MTTNVDYTFSSFQRVNEVEVKHRSESLKRILMSSSPYSTSRWTSDNDLSCSNVPLTTFYLQSESICSSHSTSMTMRPSQSLISLIDPSPPPIPPRPKKNPTETRSTRVADIIHRFETRIVPNKSSSPIELKKSSKPQPIIVYERIPMEIKSNESPPSPSPSNTSTISADSTSCSSTKSNENEIERPIFSTRFSSSEVNLAEQYRRMSSIDVIQSDTNLSNKTSQLIKTNLPLKYKQDSLLRLYG